MLCWTGLPVCIQTHTCGVHIPLDISFASNNDCRFWRFRKHMDGRSGDVKLVDVNIEGSMKIVISAIYLPLAMISCLSVAILDL